MNPCDEAIEKLNKELPDLCTIHDLMRVGIISHRNSMEYYRRKKIGPPYMRLSERRIFYPKLGVLKWLKENSFYAGEETVKSSGKITHFPSQPKLA